MLSTNEKGALAEAAIIKAATLARVGVLLPLSVERYDLILDLRPKLVRVQCKWASVHDDVVVVRCATSRRTLSGHQHTTYSRREIDAFAAYSIDLDRCFLLPIDQFAGRRAIQLRLRPSRNNQNVGINWADDFAFAATLARLGAVAQLGERQRGTLEATGSSPVGSTLAPG